MRQAIAILWPSFIFGGIGLGFCLLLVQRINKNLWSLAIRLRR